MMFSMGDAQKHSSSSTPPRRTTGRTIRVPRNRPGRHNGIPIHSCAIPTYLAAAPIAFTLDEYEALNSVSNRTAFNAGVSFTGGEVMSGGSFGFAW